MNRKIKDMVKVGFKKVATKTVWVAGVNVLFYKVKKNNAIRAATNFQYLQLIRIKNHITFLVQKI
jgi:Na+-transporting NADH:ubiquinone oxidoreductase subunit NqrE